MGWKEHEHRSRKEVGVDKARAAVLDEAKKEVLPTIREEAGRDKPIDPLQFQPILSPDNFEAEFALKNRDLIFHFWPWKYREAEKYGTPKPAWKRGFRQHLGRVMNEAYGTGVTIEEDRDMGSFFVKIAGAGAKQFWRDIAIKTVTTLHQAMGGK